MVLEGFESVVRVLLSTIVGGWRVLRRVRFWRGHGEESVKIEKLRRNGLGCRRIIMNLGLGATWMSVASRGMTEEAET